MKLIGTEPSKDASRYPPFYRCRLCQRIESSTLRRAPTGCMVDGMRVCLTVSPSPPSKPPKPKSVRLKAALEEEIARLNGLLTGRDEDIRALREKLNAKG